MSWRNDNEDTSTADGKHHPESTVFVARTEDGEVVEVVAKNGASSRTMTTVYTLPPYFATERLGGHISLDGKSLAVFDEWAGRTLLYRLH